MSRSVAPLLASSIPRKSERIAARSVDGKAVLVVLDARKLHTLNAVGTRVFELCDGSLERSRRSPGRSRSSSSRREHCRERRDRVLDAADGEGAVEVLNAGGSR